MLLLTARDRFSFCVPSWPVTRPSAPPGERCAVQGTRCCPSSASRYVVQRCDMAEASTIRTSDYVRLWPEVVMGYRVMRCCSDRGPARRRRACRALCHWCRRSSPTGWACSRWADGMEAGANEDGTCPFMKSDPVVCGGPWCCRPVPRVRRRTRGGQARYRCRPR